MGVDVRCGVVDKGVEIGVDVDGPGTKHILILISNIMDTCAMFKKFVSIGHNSPGGKILDGGGRGTWGLG